MLILTRRVGETVTIGDNAEITITVLGVKGNQVRVGINAPKSVGVHREEIYQRIKREQMESGKLDPTFVSCAEERRAVAAKEPPVV